MRGAPAVLGDSLPRLEATAKASGSAEFTGDLVLPRMLHGAVATSPYPHARILSYDIDAALAVPGVRAVVTGADIPRRRFGLMVRDETALALDSVRYVGEAVAAVAAEDRRSAIEAAALIGIEYEVWPAVLHRVAARAAGALLVNENY